MRVILLVWVALLPVALRAAEPEVIFEDSFDSRLEAGWSWIREDPDAWRIKDGGLEIRVQPGLAGTVKNALVRTAPDRDQGSFAVEVTVTNHTPPTKQYEQAGITWYVGDKPVFKLVKERVDDQLMIIPGRKPMDSASVQLRLTVAKDRWTAEYRPEAKGEFQTAATGSLPPPDKDQVSIQCYQGPEDAEHWIRFDDFRILRLPE